MPYITMKQRRLETVGGRNLVSSIAVEIRRILDTTESPPARARLVRSAFSRLINGVYGGIRVLPYEEGSSVLFEEVDALATSMRAVRDEDAAGPEGLLNYTLTRLMNEIYPAPRYADYNEIAGVLSGLLARTDSEDDEVLGMLDCCKAEYYRKYCAPYEDEKEEQNGKVIRPAGRPVAY